MSNERSLVFAEGVALQTAPGMARLVTEYHDDMPVDQDTLGLMAEWLAVAWVNVTGEEYQHREVGVPVGTKEYTEILAKQATVHAGEWVIPKAAIVSVEDAAEIATRLPRTVRVERDCE